jgi:D-inositol-3-phosphate glycosyltransferase
MGRTLALPPAAAPVAVLSVHASPLAALGSQENGGMNVYVREACRALGRLGVATDIFTRRTHPGEPETTALGPRTRLVTIAAGRPAVLEKHEYPGHLEEFLNGVRAFASRQGRPPAALQSHYWLSGWVAERLAREWDVPWFHTAHTLGRVKNARAAEGAVLESEQRIAAEQRIVLLSDVLIASTQAEADDLIALYGAPAAKVEVVPAGVDSQVFRPRRVTDLRRRLGLSRARVVLFVGRLERLKGVETLLKAFAMLEDLRPGGLPATLLVIGGDSTNGRLESQAQAGEARRLSQRARALGIAGTVRFLGPVAHEDLASYYCLADVTIVPSFTESFGLVALESQACGTPVIASRVGGLALLVKDGVTGFTIAGRSESQFAARIAQVLDDRALRRELGRRGRLWAQSYTWERTGTRLARLYMEQAVPVAEPVS